MPEATAARRGAHRPGGGGRMAVGARGGVARLLRLARELREARAVQAARGWWLGLAGAAVVAALAASAPAHAAGASAHTGERGGVYPPVQTQATLPGFNPPPPGTFTSGPIRTEPARMPFYVATRGTTTIYLLGTLHVGDPGDYPPAQPFRRPILAALAAAPTLALELSPDDLLESQNDVSKYGVCARPCLRQSLPPELWRTLAYRLRENPAALDEIGRMRPWLASLLVETYDSLSAGLQTEYGTEAQLQNVFLKKRGARIVGLETLREQMQAFTQLTLAQQREMLAQDLVQTPAQNIADVRDLHRLWRVGDADAIAAWQTAKTEKLERNWRLSEQIDNRIVYARNRRFVSRMLAIAAPNRPLFVAIGALHLGGPKGVLALLGRHGFTVEPS